MFDVYCHHCGTRVLLSPRRMLWLENTARAIVVGYRCWCGELGVLRTGRRRGGPAAGRVGERVLPEVA